LLLHVATLIGQLDDEICHGRACRLHTQDAQPGILDGMLQIKGNSLIFKIDERKGPDVRGA
jgi:hypothetical protein